MGETRDPALGNWTVFEGDNAQAHGRATANLDYFGNPQICGGIDQPLTWPLTFRVGRIRDGIAESVDVTVNEDLTVERKHERINTQTGEAVT